MGYRLTGPGRCAGGIFSIPHGLVDSGAFRELSPAACKLLVFLYAAMNARSAPCIRISLSQLVEALHMDNKTIRAARRELESKNIIRCSRAAKAGSPYELHLVNPETGEPFPPENGRSTVADYKPRLLKAARTAPQSADSRAVRVAGEQFGNAAESQPPQHAQRPQGGTSEQQTHESQDRTTCSKHSEEKGYWDANGWHCQRCEPSAYAPPEETRSSPAKASSPPLPFTPPTAEQIFGRG